MASVSRHGNSVDVSFSREVLNSITGDVVGFFFTFFKCLSVNQNMNLALPPVQPVQLFHPWRFLEET